MDKKTSTNRCYKCGKQLNENEVTEDHLPPKCFFTKENSNKALKVSACEECNLGRSKDDEYFRNWLITGAAGLNSEARKVYQNKVKRSWERRPSIKIRQRERLFKADVVTPSGLYLGQVTYANIEEHRALPVLDSIAKGILWHHFPYMEAKFPFGINPFILHNPLINNDWIKFYINITVPVILIPSIFEYRFGQLPLVDGESFNVFLIFF
jgi:hypothetical protein